MMVLSKSSLIDATSEVRLLTVRMWSAVMAGRGRRIRDTEAHVDSVPRKLPGSTLQKDLYLQWPLTTTSQPGRGSEKHWASDYPRCESRCRDYLSS